MTRSDGEAAVVLRESIDQGVLVPINETVAKVRPQYENLMGSPICIPRWRAPGGRLFNTSSTGRRFRADG